MSGIRIDLRSTDLEKASLFLEGFGPKAEAGVRQAISRAIKGVRTDSSRLVQGEYNVKASVIRKTWKISKTGHLQYTATSSGNRIPLIRFGASPKKPTSPRPVGGISVQIKGARKLIKRKNGNLPFIALWPDGHVAIFRRLEDTAYPIKESYGPSVPEMIGTDKNEVKAKLQSGAVERFEKNLNHAINRAIQQARGL